MKWFLMALCAWELGALTVGRWPTITALVHEYRGNPAVVIAVCAFNGWLYWHLLVEGMSK